MTMEMAKITSKGQITIPIAVRKELGVNDGDKILFVSNGNGFQIIKADVQAFATSDTLQTADDKDVTAISERLLKQNLTAYKELAK